MYGGTCGLSRSDTLGSVSGDNLSQLLCHSQAHRPHKLTGSTPIFSLQQHGPVAITLAQEATTSNIAVQMRHSSTTRQLQAHESGHVGANVWTSLGLRDGMA